MGLAVEVEQEAAPAEARTLGLDQPQHRLDGDRRIDGVPAALQDFPASLGGQRIGRHHHAVGIDGR